MAGKRKDIFILFKDRLRENPKFRALNPSEKWWWIDLCMFLDEQPQCGVSHWQLDRIAKALGAPLNAYQSLIEQEVLKGAHEGQQCEPYVHTDRRGTEHTLIPTQTGPIWYSSALVRDDYLRTVAQKSGRRGGGNPALRSKKAVSADTFKGIDKGVDIGVVKGMDKGVSGVPPAPSLPPTPPISYPTPLRGEVSPHPSRPLRSRREKPEPVESDAFQKFWAAWPRSARKQDVRDCCEVWNNARLDNVAEKIMAGLEKWKLSEKWTKDGGEYIEAPVVWLRKCRWRDAETIRLIGERINGEVHGKPKRISEFTGARSEIPDF